MPLYQLFAFNGADQIQKLLGSADGKGRNDHIATTVKGLLQNIRQLGHLIRSFSMGAVAVGGLYNHIIRALRLFGIPNQGTVIIAQITGE